MARPKFVQIPRQRLDRYREVMGSDYEQIEQLAKEARERLAGRAVWHVSSTLRGGGVAEMLRGFLPYVRDVGIDTRWIVLRESAEFFTLTKRIHNRLHGFPGDDGGLARLDRELYEQTLADSAGHLLRLIQEGDIVYLHDPQTAGLIPAINQAGGTSIWRCHIGSDDPSAWATSAQRFLMPYVREADVCVFTSRRYVWPGLGEVPCWIIPPGIDAFSPKNQEITPEAIEDIIGAIGLGEKRPAVDPPFTRSDGTPARVERVAEVTQADRLEPGCPLISQVSRWDRLKDHAGLLQCFDSFLRDEPFHLALVGPSTRAVADDPEGSEVYSAVMAAYESLEPASRERVHIVNLPMDDLDENGAMVNAIQRRSEIVVQKSLAEGFGLTVTEAMWKSTPVVASGLGGIQEQIRNGENGILIDDPEDLASFAGAVRRLGRDRDLARSLGEAARRTVVDKYLAPRRLVDHFEMIMRVA